MSEHGRADAWMHRRLGAATSGIAPPPAPALVVAQLESQEGAIDTEYLDGGG